MCGVHAADAGPPRSRSMGVPYVDLLEVQGKTVFSAHATYAALSGRSANCLRTRPGDHASRGVPKGHTPS